MIRVGLGGREKRQGLASGERGILSKVEKWKGWFSLTKLKVESEKGGKCFFGGNEKRQGLASEERGFLSKAEK